MKKHKLLLLIVNIVLCKIYKVFGTIDINLSELEYIASHLDNAECNRLIAALHYTSYDLPSDISGAERLVGNDITCLEHLIHWNSTPGEGRGKTHTLLAHRLQQINRSDLADWLGSTVFSQLTKDLFRSMNKPLGEQAQLTQTQYQDDESSLSINENRTANILPIIDTILISVLSVLSIGILILIIAHTIDKFRGKKRQKNRTIKIKKKPSKVYYKNAGYKEDEQVELLNHRGQPTDIDEDEAMID